jgi:diguanylate cyclase (GGDEF)-like protein
VPIIEAGLPKGTLAVESKDIDHYSEKDLQTLSAIAQIYGSALCWADRYQDIHSLATIDGLTELLNSRTFRQRMEEEIERDVRYGSAMTMLMLDIDNFKRVNDSYGHLYGDYVIKQTAQLIRASIRKADVAGRLGGEEFGVVIINSDTGSSRKTAERIRRSISGYKYVNEGIKSRISISIGMSEYPQNGDTIKEIIQHADDAMYHVKHGGGNAVHSYNELFA